MSAAPAEAYVGQIVVADLLSLALVVAGHRGSSSGGVTALGVVGLLGAAPVIHASHDRGGAALASLTLRVVTPLAGFSLGLDAAKARCAEREGDYFCGHDEALVGYLGGVAIASVVDAALLAHPRRPDRSSRHRPIALIPVPVADGLGLTLFGAL